MNRRSAAIASFIVGVALSANPALAKDTAEALPDVSGALASEYAVSPPRDFADVKLATAGTVGGQSVAVNPKNANAFVASYAAQRICWVRTSSNAGRTWTAAKKLPAGDRNCKASALIWAPDGSRVYAAYSYLNLDASFGVLLSSSTDNGRSWSPPREAAHYPSEYAPVRSLKLATPLRAGDANWLYLLIDRPPVPYYQYDFVRSSNQGKTWSVPRDMPPALVNDNYITPPSIAGGPGGEILIAWGISGCWVFPCGQPKSEIQVNRSNDWGTTFETYLTAVPSTFGDTAVGFGGGETAHVVYTVSSGLSPRTYYIYSTKAPYTTWSTPTAINGSSSATRFSPPALTVSACGSGTSVLHAVWLDNRAGSETYNVYYTRKVAKTGEPWSPNLRLSGISLPAAWNTSLNLVPAIAAGSGTAVGIWGQNDDYFGFRPAWASRISPGVSCP